MQSYRAFGASSSGFLLRSIFLSKAALDVRFSTSDPVAASLDPNHNLPHRLVVCVPPLLNHTQLESPDGAATAKAIFPLL